MPVLFYFSFQQFDIFLQQTRRFGATSRGFRLSRCCIIISRDVGGENRGNKNLTERLPRDKLKSSRTVFNGDKCVLIYRGRKRDIAFALINKGICLFFYFHNFGGTSFLNTRYSSTGLRRKGRGRRALGIV